MGPVRAVFVWIGLGVLGIVLAGAAAVAASRLTSQDIGLSTSRLGDVQRLAPSRPAKPRRPTRRAARPSRPKTAPAPPPSAPAPAPAPGLAPSAPTRPPPVGEADHPGRGRRGDRHAPGDD